ncbi:MAG: pyrroloquinoline quinone precursor peptide PqqA [Hyphomicrobiales bacterium]
MKWNAPKIIEVCCGMEISRYMPADENEPVLF